MAARAAGLESLVEVTEAKIQGTQVASAVASVAEYSELQQGTKVVRVERVAVVEPAARWQGKLEALEAGLVVGALPEAWVECLGGEGAVVEAEDRLVELWGVAE